MLKGRDFSADHRLSARAAETIDKGILVVVHNHPSGDPTPSRADIEMTKLIVKAGDGVGVRVHDHIVIGRTGHASFKTLGLI